MVQTYAKTEPQERVVGSLIERVTRIRASNTPFFGPKRSLLTTEALLVKDVLYMLQGFASEHFLWDTVEQRFSIKNGTHVSHLSMSSLYNLLASFMDAATNLRRVEIFVKRVAYESTGSWLKFRPRALPTLEAFANAVAMRLAVGLQSV
jgi:hypothetical protein